MGKKRIVTQEGQRMDKSLKDRALSRGLKKKLVSATLTIQATFNNTLVALTDKAGNVLMSSSSGALGFKGAKKGTPFAAAKIGEVLSEKAKMMGLREIDVVVKGVGSGRESAIRAFAAAGIDILSIKDKTPVPFNGPRPKKPRRV
ncbi:MAG: 30S ribosomal protein S11 [Candidatus Pacebacteria bacterium]|nr:30S ribosomal protein S11 [Candidatus Paceibacterota bacterium]